MRLAERGSASPKSKPRRPLLRRGARSATVADQRRGAAAAVRPRAPRLTDVCTTHDRRGSRAAARRGPPVYPYLRSGGRVDGVHRRRRVARASRPRRGDRRASGAMGLAGDEPPRLRRRRLPRNANVNGGCGSRRAASAPPERRPPGRTSASLPARERPTPDRRRSAAGSRNQPGRKRRRRRRRRQP